MGFHNNETIFSVRSVPSYKQDRWRNELVVGQSPAGKNVSTEAEDIVGIRHPATTGENVANWEDFMYAEVTVIFVQCVTQRACRSYL
jgi:hypothetical protein